jgi:hypothetical protein
VNGARPKAAPLQAVGGSTSYERAIFFEDDDEYENDYAALAPS